jgi:hypothetical protein
MLSCTQIFLQHSTRATTGDGRLLYQFTNINTRTKNEAILSFVMLVHSDFWLFLYYVINLQMHAHYMCGPNKLQVITEGRLSNEPTQTHPNARLTHARHVVLTLSGLCSD